MKQMMKQQAYNPYLPSWEYIPDGEPYIFENRLYVYGSHDKFNGHAYCLNDYVTWSRSLTDPSDWRYEGVIYKAEDVENNDDRDSCLYAPDVVQGVDGRYYLYYVDSKRGIVSVAVCDHPVGKFEFHGYVQYPDGVRLGEAPGDEPQFDPGVLLEDDQVYLYTGFCGQGDASRSGAMVTVLSTDMLTVIQAPRFIVPSDSYSEGSGFEGYEFFEAPSIRKRGDLYYFVYSSVQMHELCYATSRFPDRDFTYGGVIISNCDMGCDVEQPKDKPMFYGGNNHGSIIDINGQWYVFYHRHTNGTNFSRQGCMEPITFREDGSIPQVPLTSCGGNGKPLEGRGYYPTYIACHLFCNEESVYTDFTASWMNNQFPKITQEGKDGDEELGYIANMKDGATAGFKYFDIQDVEAIEITTRGYARGEFLVKTAWDGPALAKIPIHLSNAWKTYSAKIALPKGKQALYFTFSGTGSTQFASFELK